MNITLPSSSILGISLSLVLAQAWLSPAWSADLTVDGILTVTGVSDLQDDLTVDENVEIGGLLDVHGNLELGETTENPVREGLILSYSDANPYAVTLTARRGSAFMKLFLSKPGLQISILELPAVPRVAGYHASLYPFAGAAQSIPS